MAFDSAADVYRHALVMKKVDGADKLHADALLPILKSLPKNGARPPENNGSTIAMDQSSVSEAIKEIHGVKAKTMGIGGGTVAAVFRKLGLPAVVSAKLDETAHQPNEYCILDNLIGDAKIFAISALLLGERK